MFAAKRFVLEYDSRDVNGVRVQFRARRDGVIPGLKPGNGGHDDIERNRPRYGVFRGGGIAGVAASRQLEDFTELETTPSDHGGILGLVGVEGFKEGFRGF